MQRRCRLESGTPSPLYLIAITALLLFSANICFADKAQLTGIDIKGNKQLSDRTVLLALQTKTPPWHRMLWPFGEKFWYDEAIFLTDLLRIEKLYQQHGFLGAKVIDYQARFNKKGNKISISVDVEEGAATRVSELSVKFETEIPDNLSEKNVMGWLHVNPGKPYRELNIRADYDRIIQKFSDRGYPYISAKLFPVFDRENDTVTLEWRLNAGKLCLYGEIRYEGNETISNKAIRRGLGFSQGERFNQSKLLRAQSNIYRLELFQFVSLRTIKLANKPASVPIEVKVKETKLRTFKFGVGYGREESFRGFVQWRHRNFLGGARILKLTAKRSWKLLPTDLSLELSQPFFLSNLNNLTVTPFFKWEDLPGYEVQSFGVELTLNRQITDKTVLFFTTSIQKDTVKIDYAFSENSIPADQDHSKSKFRFGVNYNSTNQIFTPTRGMIFTGYIEEAGGIIRTPAKYLKIYLQQRFYQKIGKKSVVALKVGFGSMGPIFKGDLTPLEDRFFLGGSYSVRGWAIQEIGPIQKTSNGNILPIGGNSFLEGSLEWRQPIVRDIAGALFLDMGNVWPEWNQHNISDLRYALGIGLRYNTLIGPIRIDIGRKLNKQPFDKGDYAFHLSIGQAF